MAMARPGIHTMGAAVPDVTGQIFGGINLYDCTAGPCAERVALGIVAVGDHGRGPVGPCGRDRQIFFDYCPRLRTILPTPDGTRSVPTVDLLPVAAAWTPQAEREPSARACRTI